MKDTIEYLKRITEAVTRLEKSKTLNEFCKTAPKITNEAYWSLQLPSISEDNGFKEIHDVVMLRIAQAVETMEKQASIINCLQEHCKGMYDTWKPYEKDITNEALLKYLKDYEEYYNMKGGEDDTN